ncbi:MAG TPA: hypothetical protein V6D25_25675 [Leptolyngbyaceae cyanobacterium]
MPALARRVKYHSLHYHGILYVASSSYTFLALALGNRSINDWGLGTGDWGLGTGYWENSVVHDRIRFKPTLQYSVISLARSFC